MGTFCGLQLLTAQQRGSAPSRLKPTICAFCSGTSHHAPWQLSTSWAVARRQGGMPRQFYLLSLAETQRKGTSVEYLMNVH